MSEVYKAADTRLNRTVAIKTLPPSWPADPGMKQRVEREAQSIVGLNHPNICTESWGSSLLARLRSY